MGAYRLFKITFKSKEARDWFENNLKEDIQKPKRLFQYDYLGENNELECCYYMNWDGYCLGQIILKQLKKANLMKQITKFVSMDLTCESFWWDEINECISQFD